MAAPRKVFRIEETAARRREPQVEDTSAALNHAEIMQELGALRTLLTAAAPRPAATADASRLAEIERLISELHFIQAVIGGTSHTHGGHAGRAGSRAHAAQMLRVAHELDAVIISSEQATQKILSAAEDIDQAANNLSAALKGEIEQGLAQDIRDRVIQIFEACNFQDLTSQRLVKVLATLNRIEEQITRVLGAVMQADGAPVVYGPRLEDDRGHVSQSDIDIMFDVGARSA